jgi:hypothetical protein
MEQSKAMEYESRKAPSDVLKLRNMYNKAHGTYSCHHELKRHVPTGLQALLHGRKNLPEV